MSLHASPLATRYATQHSRLRLAVASLLRALSARLDAAAQSLQAESPPLEQGTLEFSRDPHTGHGVLYEGGERRFTFLQGLERL